MATTFANGIFQQIGTNTTVPTTATSTSSSNNQITVGTTTGMAVYQPIVFSYTTLTATATQTTNPGNFLLLSSATNMVVGQPISLSATIGNMILNTTYYISTISSTAPITLVGGIISRAVTTVTVNTATVHGLSTGQIVTITGTGNANLDADANKVVTVVGITAFTYTSGTSGTVSAISQGTVTPGATVQISATNGGGVFTQSNATGSATATVGGVLGGLTSGTTYFIASVVDATRITISAKSGGATQTLTTTVGTMTVTAGGAVPVVVSANNATVTMIGLSLANTTTSLVLATIYLQDGANNNNTSNFAYQLPIPPNQSLRIINGGEKLILGNSMSVYVYSSQAASLDAVASYVIIQ